MFVCPLCQRDIPEGYIESHHLDTRRESDRTVDLCTQCHRQIHALFRNYELRDQRLHLNTIEGLRENKKVQKALKFIRKQDPTEFMKVKQSNK